MLNGLRRSTVSYLILTNRLSSSNRSCSLLPVCLWIDKKTLNNDTWNEITVVEVAIIVMMANAVAVPSPPKTEQEERND
uniref:Secreted protein n=1 Tax=Angiostrongylus cantonensis TaxID=6313 RepID=A0A0K0DJ34_ANGCA